NHDAKIEYFHTFTELGQMLAKDRFINMVLIVVRGKGGGIEINDERHMLSELAGKWRTVAKFRVSGVLEFTGPSDGKATKGTDQFKKLLRPGVITLNWEACSQELDSFQKAGDALTRAKTNSDIESINLESASLSHGAAEIKYVNVLLSFDKKR